MLITSHFPHHQVSITKWLTGIPSVRQLWVSNPGPTKFDTVSTLLNTLQLSFTVGDHGVGMGDPGCGSIGWLVLLQYFPGKGLGKLLRRKRTRFCRMGGCKC